MTERRYTEEEVAEIFRRATETATRNTPQLPSGEGISLAQLQEIGREVGVAPDLVARAAMAVDRPTPVTERRLLGFPIGVGRTVELGRRLSDDEWERLVVDLRETFDAKGKVSHDGTLRQWTNGNLQAYVEPGEHGQRLRMRTYNAASQGIMLAGGVYAAFGVFAVVLVLAKHGIDPGRLAGAGVLAAAGLGIVALGALRLPGWARRRLAQMESIANRLLAAPKPADDNAER